jgi:hypothetical protein
MTKPILWLGPAEDIDADYDPLLGRSVKEPAPQTSATSVSTLAPDQSVFDDPESLARAPQSRPVEPSFQESVKPEPEPEPLTVAEFGPEPVPETVQAEQVATVAPPEPDAPIDYRHNNEAIPERILPPEAEALSPSEATPIVQTTEPEKPKSFLTRLFTSKPAVAAGAAGAAIAATPLVSRAAEETDDIWARIATDAQAKPEPTQDMDETAIEPTDALAVDAAPLAPPSEAELDAGLVSEPEPEAALAPAVEDFEATTTEVEPQAATADSVDAGAPALVASEVEETSVAVESDPVVIEPPPEPPPGPVEAEAEADAEPIDTPEAVEAPAADPVQIEASNIAEPEPSASDFAAEPGPADAEAVPVDVAEALPEPAENPAPIEVTEEAPAEALEALLAPVAAVAGTVAAATHPFSRAFNADKFWTVGDDMPNDQAAKPSLTSIEEVDESDSELASINPVKHDAETNPDARADITAEPVLRVGSDDRPLRHNEDQFVPADTTSEAARAERPARPAGQKRRRKKKQKKNYVGAFFGTFVFGIALIMTLVSSLSALGYPFDLMSSYRWYWVILAVASTAIWGVTRGWKMVAASFAVIGLNLLVTVPASGVAPAGGKMAAVIGWANVNENPDALARVIKDADAKGATLIMLAEAPPTVFQPPAGWALIEAPVANDPTAIAVLSKGSWRAVTVPGEPTMARPPAGDITVIGVHPHDAQKGRRSTPIRDALINRAGARAGIQEGPTVVVGDFNAAPWDRAMRQFREYGKITRVRCGGWAAGTYNQVFGLVSVATDHAYVRDVKVTHCQLGAGLPGGNHKPIWLYVAPQALNPDGTAPQ